MIDHAEPAWRLWVRRSGMAVAGVFALGLVALIGLVVTGISLAAKASQENARILQAEVDLRLIVAGAVAFHANYGRWPAAPSELTAPPPKADGTPVPPILQALPVDPWSGAPYLTRVAKSGDFVVETLGRDGLVGGFGSDTDRSDSIPVPVPGSAPPALLTVAPLTPQGEVRVITAEVDLKILEELVVRFYGDYGQWPTSLSELAAPPPVRGARAPQPLITTVPTDPWTGTSFLTRFDPQGNWIIETLGSDGAPGGIGEAADRSVVIPVPR